MVVERRREMPPMAFLAEIRILVLTVFYFSYHVPQEIGSGTFRLKFLLVNAAHSITIAAIFVFGGVNLSRRPEKYLNSPDRARSPKVSSPLYCTDLIPFNAS